MSKKNEKCSCKAHHTPVKRKEVAPVRYIELAELEKKLETGIPLDEVKQLETAWTASNVPVMEHLNYLRAIGALSVRDGVLVLARVAA